MTSPPRRSQSPTLLLAGAGAHGMGAYVRKVLPRLHAEGVGEAVGVVEPYADRRMEALRALDLPPERGFADVRTALDATRPDALIVASPYKHHESACLAAAERGVHLFIEKPVADDLAACCRTARAAERAGIRAAVNMSAAFEPEKLAFGRFLADDVIGTPEYIFGRMAWDHRHAARGRKHHRHPYLMEGGVHLLEMLLRYAGGIPVRVYTMAWPSPHSVYSGLASVLVSFETDTGVRCALEGSWTSQAGISTWRDEYIRADGARGALLLERRELHRLEGQGKAFRAVPLDYDRTESPGGGTEVLLRSFLDWITGRRADHPTALDRNLHTMALLFAANASADRRQAVDVRDWFARAAHEEPTG